MVIGCSKGLKYRLENESTKFSIKQNEILRSLSISGKKIIDFQAGDLTRYKEDGYENKVATYYLIKAAKERWDSYPGLTAYPGRFEEDPRYRLRQAICNFLEKNCRFNLDSEHMLLGHAVSGCFAILHKALLDPGDEICVIEPSHYVSMYNNHLLMLQSKMITTPSNSKNNWEPDFDKLRKNITNRTKAIVLENPTNPQGVIYSDRTIKKIINIAGEYEIPIISDETYQLITFDGLKAKTIASFTDDVPVIIISSMTKFFMKPGWCLGYIYFHDPKGNITELENAGKLISNTSGFGSTRIPTPILIAATWTFEDPKSIDDCFKMVNDVQLKRDFTNECLHEIDDISFIKPQCALYGLIKIKQIGKKHSPWSNDYEFCHDILKKEGLYFSPGSNFGKSSYGYVRTLLYRNKMILEEGYNRLEQYMIDKKDSSKAEVL